MFGTAPQAQANGNKILAPNKAIAEAMTLLMLERIADKAKKRRRPYPSDGKNRLRVSEPAARAGGAGKSSLKSCFWL